MNTSQLYDTGSSSYSILEKTVATDAATVSVSAEPAEMFDIGSLLFHQDPQQPLGDAQLA